MYLDNNMIMFDDGIHIFGEFKCDKQLFELFINDEGPLLSKIELLELAEMFKSIANTMD